MSTARYQRYNELRKSKTSMYGYGLGRRTEQLVATIDRLKLPVKRVVDMGCADDTMLRAICDRFTVHTALGFDRFDNGTVSTIDPIILYRHDLYQKFPYPCVSGSIDLIVVSAFFKHHPNQAAFLKECERILDPNGAIVFLDPRYWVVFIGSLFGYFNPQYCPHPWTPKSLTAQLPSTLRIVDVENYWISPIHSLKWIEKLIPSWLRKWIALHQCVVVRRG